MATVILIFALVIFILTAFLAWYEAEHSYIELDKRIRRLQKKHHQHVQRMRGFHHDN